MLYPENLPLVDDLVSYIAIGARSVENPTHRFVASGIDVPTGLKNPTSGNLKVMFNGIFAAQKSSPSFSIIRKLKLLVTHLPMSFSAGSERKWKIPANYYYDNLLETIEIYQQFGLKIH